MILVSDNVTKTFLKYTVQCDYVSLLNLRQFENDSLIFSFLLLINFIANIASAIFAFSELNANFFADSIFIHTPSKKK
jgi:hypothetical protein